MSNDSLQNLPEYVSELFDLIKNNELDKVLAITINQNTFGFEYGDAGQRFLNEFVEDLSNKTEGKFDIPQDLKSKIPVLAPNKVVQTEFVSGEIKDFTILDIVKGNKNDIKPKFGPDDDKIVNNNLSNAFNHDPSSGIDKIKRYMEHLKVPGGGNKDGDEKDIMKKLGIMKKSLKIATLASTFGYELADMYLHIVTEELKQM